MKITEMNETINIEKSVLETIEVGNKITNTDAMEMVMKYIHRHYDDPKLTVMEICEYINYTPSHFTRLFKKLYDTTPAKYINLYRINVAKDLLSENVAICHVYKRVGFYSARTFNRVFKQIVNMTPTEYRKRIK